MSNQSRVVALRRAIPLWALVFFVATVATTARASAESDDCIPAWTPRYGAEPGANSPINAFVNFDDGEGPALFAGGSFASIAGLPLSRIARWDGETWSPVGGGVNDVVRAMTVFDDGSGPALYVAGAFSEAGGVAASHVARWDGDTWSPVGSGTNAIVYALIPFDDGTGPALYAGGSFTTAGGVAANRIARWDGAEWSPLGAGIAGTLPHSGVLALEVLDDGTELALYAAGKFTTAGGLPANAIARWNGVEWSDVGGSIDGSWGAHVYALRTADDGSGPALYVGGNFVSAGGVWAPRLARWDGSGWAAVASGSIQGWVLSIGVFDDGSGPTLVAAGNFTVFDGVSASGIARRTHDGDGPSWGPIGGGLIANEPWVYALGTYDDGNGPRLFAGGIFYGAGDVAAHRIASTDGDSWSTVGDHVGLGGHNQTSVRAVVEFDDGTGPGLFAGGIFTSAAGEATQGIAKWDETTQAWMAIGGGVNGTVLSLAVFDDGSGDGPALYVGGGFTMAGDVPANNVVRWGGPDRGWSALRGGLSSAVRTMIPFDDGSGPALYVGGTFVGADGMLVNRLARWEWTRDGGEWSPLGDGVDAQVHELAVFDDGSGAGPQLYVGGSFNHAGDVPVKKIARWDGTTWTPLGEGASNAVMAMTVFDDGQCDGPALYVTGSFSSIGGISDVGVGRWNGTSWTGIGSAFNESSQAIAFFDDGSGPALHVGGYFTAVGEVAIPHLARWSGSGWEVVDPLLNRHVFALLVTDDVDGAPALHVGGEFAISSSTDSYLMRRQGCPIVPPPILGDLNGDGVVDAADLATLLSAWGPCRAAGACSGACFADFNGDGIVDGADLGILLTNWSFAPN